MEVQIYTMTHKQFEIPSDPMYVPLQVGSSLHPHLGYLTDDTGDNISSLNCYFSELTGLYWIWKNVHDVDYVGICHYRRFLLNDTGYIFTKSQLIDTLSHYDILTSKKLNLNFSYFYGFGKNHSPKDLVVTGEVILKLYPDFYPLYEKRVHEKHTYFGNIMICKKSILDEYCAWLFPIFFEMHKIIDLDSYDDYHKRLYGFISEFLLMVWIEYKNLKVKECKVGIIGSKTETSDVILHLRKLIAQKRITDAKSYFLDVHKKRPDILMEASDLDYTLHDLLQVLSVCEKCPSLLDNSSDPEYLLALVRKINQIILRMIAQEESHADLLFLCRDDIPYDVISVSILLYTSKNPLSQEALEKRIKKLKSIL